jgi:NADH-quinone oxidoreductase subunit K
MNTPLPYLLLGTVLLILGLAVTIVRRHPIVVLLGLELAFQGINLVVGALTSRFQDWDGQVLAIVLITVSGVEFAIGLGITSRLAQKRLLEEQA